MNFNHKILSHIYYPYKAVQNIATLFDPINDKKLRVLLFHDIAKKDFDKFKEKLEWLSKEWNFINADDFGKMINGDKKITSEEIFTFVAAKVEVEAFNLGRTQTPQIIGDSDKVLVQW